MQKIEKTSSENVPAYDQDNNIVGYLKPDPNAKYVFDEKTWSWHFEKSEK